MSQEEITRINNYVKKHIPIQLENYKIIYVNNKKIEYLLVENKDDGVLLNEIYLEKNIEIKG